MKAIFAAVFACFVLGGCLGYHVGPVKPYYLRDVHTIAVPTFENKTLLPRIEVLVTDTVIKQLQQDGTFQIASDERCRRHLERSNHANRQAAGTVCARECA